VASSPVSIGIWDPRGVVVSPDGRFVYVIGRRGPSGPPASNADTAVAALTISPDGSLHTIAGSPLYFSGQINGFGASLTPDGKHLYVAVSNTDKILAMDVNQTSGALSVMAGSPYATAGDTPSELAIEPDGDQLWVSEAFGKSVEGFGIDPTTGALTQTVDPVVMTSQTHAVATTADASSLYLSQLADPGAVAGFSVDNLSLTALGGSPFPTGGPFPNFFSVAVTPTQTPDAKFKASGGKANEPLPFNASATTVAGGFPARYDWNFGDGFNLGNGGPKPTHTYLEDGKYKVTLTVRNDCASDAVFTGDVVATGSAIFCNGPATATVKKKVTVDSKVDGKLKAKKTQKQKPGKIVVKAKVKAGEPLKAKVKGKIEQDGESFALKAKSKSVKAGKSKTLKLKLKKKSQAASLAPGKAKATLKGKLADDFGNTSKKKLKVKLIVGG
jgi:DNA-binding beta-propeller fold protein YncE